MNHWRIFIIMLVASAMLSLQNASAQTKPANKNNSGTKFKNKITPPKLTTSLGILKETVTVSIDQAKAVIGSTLKVTDDKNNPYTITYYQLLYKQKIMTEDEKTGKQSPSQKTVSQSFKSTPLAASWVKRLSEDFAAGEELLFFDIIVKDNQGHLFYAPALQIKLK